MNYTNIFNFIKKLKTKRMPQFKTTCPRDCYDACGMIVETENKKIISIKGDPSHPVTRGFLCPRGANDINRMKTNRILYPSIKKNSDFEKNSWDLTITLVSKKLKETLAKYGNHSILYLDYSGNEGLYNNIFAKRLWYSLGATFTDGALCTASGHAALKLHYGDSFGIQATELANQKLIIFWGFNAAVTSPHTWKLALQARKKNNAKIIVIDPIKNLSAKNADLFIQLFPGTDTALAFSIINKLISDNKIDNDFIKNFTLGFQELKEEAKKWTIKRTSEFCNIDIEKIELLTNLYSESKPSATYMGVGLQKREMGTEAIRAISFIPAILGFHRGFFYANSHGLLVDKDLISGENIYPNSKYVSQVNLGEQIKNGDFKFIFINSTNPAVTHTNLLSLIEGLQRKDVFVVVNETHWTKTAELANIVLAVPTFLEKDDVMLSWGHNYTRYSQQVIEPITDSKTEIWIMQEIAKKLNLTDNFIFEDHKKVILKAFENTVDKNDKLYNSNNDLVKLKTKANDFYPTESGKIEFYSSQAQNLGINPLPVQTEIIRRENKFILLTTAVAKHTNSQFTEVFGKIPSEISISIDDAKRLNIKNEQIVKIKNELAELYFKAKISDSVQKNVLVLPRFVEDLNGTPSNVIFSGKFQKLGNGPTMHSTLVEISF